jgi:hypothetical protein
MKKLTIGATVLLAIGLGMFFFVVPKRVDRTHNFVYPSSPPPRPSSAARVENSPSLKLAPICRSTWHGDAPTQG